MPDAVPGWFNHVRSPLVLTDETATTVLALNGEARRLFGALGTPAVPCALAALIGEAAQSFADQMRGEVDVDMSGDMETAVARASVDAAHSGLSRPVVLLSPACASFDQFKDFEHRGDTFRAIVGGLKGVRPRQMAEA